MKFGVFSVVDHYPAELPRMTAQFHGELLEQVGAAAALGFDSFWVAAHDFHEDGSIPSPPVWMAVAAQRPRRIHFGAALTRGS
ncbi:MAG: LLM class flavin-dependent oxidoreductase [Candidatus Rokubacteria bacterium]|nr:LLM class flavin-dependent oxidoreductase [Candidatus Rokubacteria bacterium]MBI3825107.1 LLM class flavin-dependent oxidoreductase [Candidatus Rokubacteria bacterium]